MSQTVQSYRRRNRFWRDWKNPFSWFQWAQGTPIPGAITDPADHFVYALGGTIVADYDAAVNVRPVSGVVGVHDDRRVSTPDGQVFVPGVAGEGLLSGDVTEFNAAAAITVMAEFSQQPGSAQTGGLLARRTGGTATTSQFDFRCVTGSALLLVIGDGGAVASVCQSVAASIVAGIRYRVFVRYDGSAGTDATKVTVWIPTYNPLTLAWGVVAQSATTVTTPGVPAALISITSNVGFGRFSDSTSNVLFG